MANEATLIEFLMLEMYIIPDPFNWTKARPYPPNWREAAEGICSCCNQKIGYNKLIRKAKGGGYRHSPCMQNGDS